MLSASRSLRRPRLMATQKLAVTVTTASTAGHQIRSSANQATRPSRLTAMAWSGTSHSRRHAASSAISAPASPATAVTRLGMPPSCEAMRALPSSAQAAMAEGERYQRSMGRARVRAPGARAAPPAR